MEKKVQLNSKGLEALMGKGLMNQQEMNMMKQFSQQTKQQQPQSKPAAAHNFNLEAQKKAEADRKAAELKSK